MTGAFTNVHVPEAFEIRTITALALMLALSLAFIPCPSLAGEVFTLERAIATALDESPFLASRRNEVSAFEQRERAARGALLPRVDAYSSYTRLNDPQVVVPIKSFGAVPPAFSRDQYKVGIEVEIPVYEGGRLRKGILLAGLSRAASRQGLRFTRQELIYNVTNVFNEVLFWKALEQAREETLGALKRLRADARVRLDVGRLAPVDLMRIDAQVAEQEYSLVTAREERQRALETLAQLLGRVPGEVEDVTGDLGGHEAVQLLSSPGELEEIVRQRPDIRQAEEEVKLAGETIGYEKGLHLPQVDLVGDYSRRAGSGFDSDEEVWSGGVTFRLNIFSGGVISAKVREAEARYLAARNRYRHLLLEGLAQAEHAVSAMQEARERLAAARAAMKAAEESFRVEEISYSQGAGTVTDSLLAQAAWSRSKAAVCQAMLDCKKAVMDYRLATGKVEE